MYSNIYIAPLQCIYCADLHDVKCRYERINLFIHSIAFLQVHFYSEALPTQHGYCAGVSCRSAIGNCELRTWPRSLRGG